ncbi:hypothetical protein A2U01_0102063, partial [Trifolium medium]|nr:hypothetical protein [Trifolium medium]
AEAAKEEEAEDDDNMDGFQTDHEDEDYSNDEELQSPTDEVDPFIFFVDTMKGTPTNL